MNSVKELVSYGISEATSVSMIEGYKKRIGMKNGDFIITDIRYEPDSKIRLVSLKCSNCGETLKREMIKGRNKWSELIKTCPACKARHKAEQIAETKKAQEKLLNAEIGKRYGDFEVSEIIYGTPIKLKMVCVECGKIQNISFPMIRSGKWKDQKCHKHFSNIKYDETYIGKTFGFLTVIGVNKTGIPERFICRCVCGKTKNVRPIELIHEKTKSCGCKHNELLITHGGSSERLYHVWQDMKARCNYKKCREYSNYGGRGIKVCEEWCDYSIFRQWAYKNGYDESAPFGAYTIDRIDVNGNYEPNNCRWITNAEQQKNKRPSFEWKKRKFYKKSSFIMFEGMKVPKSKLCEKYGISVQLFNYRYFDKGMSIYEALNTPKMCIGRPRRVEVTTHEI